MEEKELNSLPSLPSITQHGSGVMDLKNIAGILPTFNGDSDFDEWLTNYHAITSLCKIDDGLEPILIRKLLTGQVGSTVSLQRKSLVAKVSSTF